MLRYNKSAKDIIREGFWTEGLSLIKASSSNEKVQLKARYIQYIIYSAEVDWFVSANW